MANHAVVVLLVLVLTCLCTALPAVRSRRKVHKRARPPEGGPTDLPNGTNNEQYLNMRLIFLPSNASGSEPNPVLQDLRVDDTAGGKVVAVETFESGKDWIVAQFVNESLQPPPHVRHARPFRGWTLMLLAVSLFLVPFLFWFCCMIACIYRAYGREAY
ncbi:hypothetical protein HPB52_011522 [Rhipicephalus sanguineus]|uniref:Uncharacterized protein n=1 Tax=Rhipicephalus sanguineus TaxID=34632 RepID=A0A9D4T9J7_RHISA|nr:hypothetical protein HPB52_011522 [Rhipicephalus sanguineus]